jgi:hypothetical protein
LPVLDSLAEDDVRVTVDLLNLITGTHLLEPFVSVSVENVEVRSAQPSRITVIITGVLTTTDKITETLSIRSNMLLIDHGPGGAEQSSPAMATVHGFDFIAVVPFATMFYPLRRKVRR